MSISQQGYKDTLSSLGKILHHLKIIFGYYNKKDKDYDLYINKWNPLSYLYILFVLIAVVLDRVFFVIPLINGINNLKLLWIKDEHIIEYSELSNE